MLDLAMQHRTLLTFVEAKFMLILKTFLEMKIRFLNKDNITFIRFLDIWHEMAA